MEAYLRGVLPFVITVCFAFVLSLVHCLEHSQPNPSEGTVAVVAKYLLSSQSSLGWGSDDVNLPSAVVLRSQVTGPSYLSILSVAHRCSLVESPFRRASRMCQNASVTTLLS